MNKMLTIAALMAVCMSTANAADYPCPRSEAASNELREGVRTGNLTPRETAKLENKEKERFIGKFAATASTGRD